METFKNYDELKIGDGIFWYGMKAIITDIAKTDEDVYFSIKPLNDEEEKILGKFYANGRYGGLKTLRAWCWR